MVVNIITKDDLAEFKNDLIQELKALLVEQKNVNGNVEWLRSGQVRKLLNVSPGTLQNLRVQGKLRFTKLGSLIYYHRKDIELLLDGK
jgi:hypothetical protein